MTPHNGRRHIVHNASAAMEAVAAAAAAAAVAAADVVVGRWRQRTARRWLLGVRSEAQRWAAFRFERAEAMAESAERREQRSSGGERPGGGRGGSSSCKQAGAKKLSARPSEVPEVSETAIKNLSCLKQPSK